MFERQMQMSYVTRTQDRQWNRLSFYLCGLRVFPSLRPTGSKYYREKTKFMFFYIKSIK